MKDPEKMLEEIIGLMKEALSKKVFLEKRLTIAQKEFELACMKDDDAVIEKARIELVETFSATIDASIEINKKHMAMQKKYPI